MTPAAKLERDYRAWHEQAIQPVVHAALYLALAMLIGLIVLDRWLMHTGFGEAQDLIEFGIQLPLLLLGLHASSRASFRTRFLRVAPWGALLFGLASLVLALDGSAAQTAVFSARLIFSILFVYFLVGFSFRVALRTNAILFGGYVALGLATHRAPQLLVYQGFVLLCANLFGALGAYALDRASRVAFLERRTLAEVATLDGLTGLLNRAAFETQIRRLWDQAARERVPLAVVMIDIDHFKAFNDRYGHVAGDECLRTVAQAIRQAASRRPLDFVARYGGEELIAVLFGADSEFAERAGRRVLEAVSRLGIEHTSSPTKPFVTVSVGAVSVPAVHAESHELVIRRADLALYRAKAAGRDCCVLSSEDTEEPARGASAGGILQTGS